MEDCETASAGPEPAAVNEPEDAPFDWDAVNWRSVERDIQRLRQRIFATEKSGAHKKVSSMQRLMLRCWSNTLISVRRATEQNTGRKTAGVDGKTVLNSSSRAELAGAIQRTTTPWQARPVRRVHIPKSMENSGRWGFRPSQTASSRTGCVTRWNPSGRHDSSRSPTDFDPDAGVTMRSQLSSMSPGGKPRARVGARR